ncbi:hypothetical protein [Neobacillus dielmonensis]|uniref:hypothetical protein n=1 Tax=Neobacillus dielmonensis TaxID=1347369 RepID=UPI0005A7980F|nr:hypothetical protein [Neobacillus dielmonensis]
MSNQEFLKKAVRNMDRDVEYENPNLSVKQEANHSDEIQKLGLVISAMTITKEGLINKIPPLRDTFCFDNKKPVEISQKRL